MTALEGGEPPALPATAAETTAERPWPVGLLSQKVRDYVNRMSVVWVRGELVQVSRGKGALVFMTLRDTDMDASFSVSMRASAFARLPLEPQQGSEVVV
ncbi:MAG: exodeoxyribonuclease VII large subunit, partial [Dermabacter sp.]|nr:exodeoxyribonuclease VII large subunit [Dermabacter sp.]